MYVNIKYFIFVIFFFFFFPLIFWIFLLYKVIGVNSNSLKFDFVTFLFDVIFHMICHFLKLHEMNPHYKDESPQTYIKRLITHIELENQPLLEKIIQEIEITQNSFCQSNIWPYLSMLLSIVANSKDIIIKMNTVLLINSFFLSNYTNMPESCIFNLDLILYDTFFALQHDIPASLLFVLNVHISNYHVSSMKLLMKDNFFILNCVKSQMSPNKSVENAILAFQIMNNLFDSKYFQFCYGFLHSVNHQQWSLLFEQAFSSEKDSNDEFVEQLFEFNFNYYCHFEESRTTLVDMITNISFKLVWKQEILVKIISFIDDTINFDMVHFFKNSQWRNFISNCIHTIQSPTIIPPLIHLITNIFNFDNLVSDSELDLRVNDEVDHKEENDSIDLYEVLLEELNGNIGIEMLDFLLTIFYQDINHVHLESIIDALVIISAFPESRNDCLLIEKIFSWESFIEDLALLVNEGTYILKSLITLIFSNIMTNHCQFIEVIYRRVDLISSFVPLLWANEMILSCAICEMFMNVIMNCNNEEIVNDISNKLLCDDIMEYFASVEDDVGTTNLMTFQLYDLIKKLRNNKENDYYIFE
ncbi:hypothetical protein TRFO_01322 [Tritrichomonas foetus]|uniref:Uncharacterized protein n=1 Tax=Tritrichomonas foetus TaxID=1144522 RepID=A0A1J4K887_9EUKA|nr:hypothetical protein TRFO_01322 [Tritrichomonas foetus]|eukprot:OHT07186.1 hypothetical protein TRFO_01322 [Tritrichomonas foetus]